MITLLTLFIVGVVIGVCALVCKLLFSILGVVLAMVFSIVGLIIGAVASVIYFGYWAAPIIIALLLILILNRKRVEYRD